MRKLLFRAESLDLRKGSRDSKLVLPSTLAGRDVALMQGGPASLVSILALLVASVVSPGFVPSWPSMVSLLSRSLRSRGRSTRLRGASGGSRGL
jgi:hypothetical protein